MSVLIARIVAIWPPGALPELCSAESLDREYAQVDVVTLFTRSLLGSRSTGPLSLMTPVWIASVMRISLMNAHLSQ